MKEYKDHSGKLCIELWPKASHEKLLSFAKLLQTRLEAKIVEKLDGLDQVYWGFQIDDHIFTLHMDTFAGISLFPKNEIDDDLLRKVASKLMKQT
jgi:GGDEF domain-containing protein